MPISPNVLMRLKHPDPAVRRQAVIEAARSGDIRAMTALREVFQNDADPALRELARKAGQYLREQAAPGAKTGASPSPSAPRSAASGPPAKPNNDALFMPVFDEPDLDALMGAPSRRPTPIPSLYDAPDDPQIEQVMRAASTGYIAPEDLYAEAEDPAEAEAEPAAPAYSGPMRGHKYPVSKENIEKGKYFTEQALSQNASGQNDKAMKSVANALVANPNLVNDQYYMNVASGVTGLEGDGAIQMIVNTQQRKSFVKTQEQRRKSDKVRQQKETAEADTWGSILFELVIFAVVNFGAAIILTIIAQQALRLALGDLSPSALQQANISRKTLDSLTAFIDVSIGPLLVLSLTSVVFQALSILLQGVFIHTVARLMRRIGTYAHLMTLMLHAYNRWLPVLYTVIAGAIYLTALTAGSPLLLCLAIVLIITTGYTSLKITSAIGQAYNGGSGMGCLLLLIAGLFQVLIAAGVTLVFGSAAGALVSQLLGIPI